MALDPAPLATLAASFIDALEAEYGADAELVDAVILVELRSPDPDPDAPDDGTLSTVEGRILSGRDVCYRGLLIRGLMG